MRVMERLKLRGLRLLGRDGVSGARIRRVRGLRRVGSRGGGWVVPAHLLRPGAVCYCAGCGGDVSFDLALARDFGCEVHAFDPTPRAIAHAADVAAGVQGFHFQPVGVWDVEGTLDFFAPRDSSHVSHSLVNLQSTHESIRVPVDRLGALMRTGGHDHLDVLKLDVEGAEHRVIAAMLEDGIRPRALCVEFDELHHAAPGHRERIRGTVSRLLAAGYDLARARGRANYTFISR